VPFKKAILYKRITSAVLLMVLFAVSGIQVFHSHTSRLAYKQKTIPPVKKGITDCNKSSSDRNCFICDYNLTKDADFDIALPSSVLLLLFPDTQVFSLPFSTQYSGTVFETRGPPAIAI